jgi:hypothetical protein
MIAKLCDCGLTLIKNEAPAPSASCASQADLARRCRWRTVGVRRVSGEITDSFHATPHGLPSTSSRILTQPSS